nr:LysR substrate-binding domain-containing protein [Lujinxingia litoralis]
MHHREADIALRNFRPTDTKLVARKIRDERVHLYATPAYLECLGNPTTLGDLSRANYLGFNRAPDLREHLNSLGLTLTPLNFPVLTENHLMLWELVKQGAGNGLMMESVGDAEPGVQRVLSEIEPFLMPKWFVSRREVQTSRRVRVVFDMVWEGLGGGRG